MKKEGKKKNKNNKKGIRLIFNKNGFHIISFYFFFFSPYFFFFLSYSLFVFSINFQKSCHVSRTFRNLFVQVLERVLLAWQLVILATNDPREVIKVNTPLPSPLSLSLYLSLYFFFLFHEEIYSAVGLLLQQLGASLRSKSQQRRQLVPSQGVRLELVFRS